MDQIVRAPRRRAAEVDESSDAAVSNNSLTSIRVSIDMTTFDHP